MPCTGVGSSVRDACRPVQRSPGCVHDSDGLCRRSGRLFIVQMGCTPFWKTVRPFSRRCAAFRDAVHRSGAPYSVQELRTRLRTSPRHLRLVDLVGSLRVNPIGELNRARRDVEGRFIVDRPGPHVAQPVRRLDLQKPAVRQGGGVRWFCSCREALAASSAMMRLNAEAWAMRPEILEQLARTLQILADEGPPNLSVEALWVGEAPHSRVVCRSHLHVCGPGRGVVAQMDDC